MVLPVPTKGQLERDLSQAIQSIYNDNLGHRPSKISCHLSKDRITILMEDSITPVEQFLFDKGQEELAEQVRTDLIAVLEKEIVQTVEDVIGVKVADLLSDAGLETGRTGIIVVLESPPNIRSKQNGKQHG